MKRRLVAIILVIVLMIPSFSAFAEEETVDISLINEIINLIEDYHHYDVTREELITGAYKGILSVLDKHSTYFTEDEYDDFIDSLNGEFIGIGIYIEAYENYIKVISPIEGMPAFNAGILSGDIITHVDDLDVTKYTFEKAIDLILGEENTEVKITINRGGEVLDFIIIRQLILVPDVTYELLENNIGYLKIVQFGNDVAAEVDTAIIDMQNQGMTSIIIDMRNNPGGYLQEVVKIAEWFVDPSDPILHVNSRAFVNDDYYASTKALNIPTMVLINSGTASASEILAGAIQNNNEGTIIGETSYGKGTVQNLLTLSDGSAVKLTTAEYESAGYVTVNNVGITPDIVLETKNQAELDQIKYFAPMIGEALEYHGKTGINTFGAQQRLKFLGYDVEPTGIFDAKTFSALESYQKTNSLDKLHALYMETIESLNITIDNYLNEDIQLERAKIEILEK